MCLCGGGGGAGGHINPAVTFGLFLARKLSLTRAVFYIVMQCLGAICGAGVVKGFQKSQYERLGGGANTISKGYSKGDGLGAEIVGTFVLVYTVFSATDAKRNARDSHVPVSKRSYASLFLIINGCKFNDHTILLFMFRSWRHCLLGLLCFWFTWPPSPSQVLASTLLGVLGQPSFTTRTKLGMTM